MKGLAFSVLPEEKPGGGGRQGPDKAGVEEGGAGVVSHVWKVQSGQFNSKPMRQANFPARSAAAASEERLTLTVVITVTLAPNLKSREERSGQDTHRRASKTTLPLN